MRAFCSMLALSAALAMQPATAQTIDDLNARMNAAMATAQAEAVRPGDEALTCEQIEAETVVIDQDPEYQAHVAAANQITQDMQEEARGARGRVGAQIVGNIALGVARSYVPGLGYAQSLADRLQGDEESEPEASPQAVAMMTSVEAQMPYIMRNQRLYELARTQQCAFMEEPEAPQPEQASPQE
ncbi:MAG: hypothetical protein ACREH4_08675 [Vitreimonas sp.]